jgi:hypothetical protein
MKQIGVMGAAFSAQDMGSPHRKADAAPGFAFVPFLIAGFSHPDFARGSVGLSALGFNSEVRLIVHNHCFP